MHSNKFTEFYWVEIISILTYQINGLFPTSISLFENDCWSITHHILSVFQKINNTFEFVFRINNIACPSVGWNSFLICTFLSLSNPCLSVLIFYLTQLWFADVPCMTNYQIICLFSTSISLFENDIWFITHHILSVSQIFSRVSIRFR